MPHGPHCSQHVTWPDPCPVRIIQCQHDTDWTPSRQPCYLQLCAGMLATAPESRSPAEKPTVSFRKSLKAQQAWSSVVRPGAKQTCHAPAGCRPGGWWLPFPWTSRLQLTSNSAVLPGWRRWMHWTWSASELQRWTLCWKVHMTACGSDGACSTTWVKCPLKPASGTACCCAASFDSRAYLGLDPASQVHHDCRAGHASARTAASLPDSVPPDLSCCHTR